MRNTQGDDKKGGRHEKDEVKGVKVNPKAFKKRAPTAYTTLVGGYPQDGQGRSTRMSQMGSSRVLRSCPPEGRRKLKAPSRGVRTALGKARVQRASRSNGAARLVQDTSSGGQKKREKDALPRRSLTLRRPVNVAPTGAANFAGLYSSNRSEGLKC